MNNLRTAFLFALLVSPALAQAPALQDLAALGGKPSGTTVYVAKSFLTMDDKLSRAEAVAVRDGRFVAVGKLADVQAAAGKDAKLDRTFADKVVVAGFVEQHVHPLLAALTMNTHVISIEDWDAIDGFSPAVRDPKAYQERLKKALAGHADKTKPFVTWGYHHYMHGELTRAALDKLAPDFPVLVWHRSCHEVFLNTAGLKLAGIDAELVAGLPKSARAMADLEKGHFYEQGMLAIVDKFVPLMATPAAFRNGLEYTVRYYHRNGVTVACEPGGITSKPVQDAINAVYGDDATPFIHYFIPDGKDIPARHPNDPKAVVAATEQLLTWGKGRTAYLPKQVKLFCDGAIFSQLMQMKGGYTDGHKGAWMMDPPVFGYAFQTYWDAGYQIHIHNNGDAGFDQVLGELEKAMKRAPRKDHRTTLVHFGFAQAEQTKRWLELGGLVSSNPYYVTALAGPYETIGLGPDRAKNIAPHKYVLENKGRLSFHSDMPMAPAKPMQLVWAGVNRLTYEGKTAGAEHAVPLDVALRAVTSEAAYSLRLENEIGSIEAGKRANLTVLEADPYEVKPADLKDMKVWGTMLEGRVQPVKADAAKPEAKPERKPARSGEPPARQPIRWDDRTPSGCQAGCSCRFGHVLAAHIVSRLEAEKSSR